MEHRCSSDDFKQVYAQSLVMCFIVKFKNVISQWVVDQPQMLIKIKFSKYLLSKYFEVDSCMTKLYQKLSKKKNVSCNFLILTIS